MLHRHLFAPVGSRKRSSTQIDGQQPSRALRVWWRNPHMLFVYAMKTAMHYHYASITGTLARADDDVSVLPDAVRSFSRSLEKVRPTLARANRCE